MGISIRSSSSNIARSARGDRRTRRRRGALGEIVAYLEFELKNHPQIEDCTIPSSTPSKTCALSSIRLTPRLICVGTSSAGLGFCPTELRGSIGQAAWPALGSEKKPTLMQGGAPESAPTNRARLSVADGSPCRARGAPRRAPSLDRLWIRKEGLRPSIANVARRRGPEPSGCPSKRWMKSRWRRGLGEGNRPGGRAGASGRCRRSRWEPCSRQIREPEGPSMDWSPSMASRIPRTWEPSLGWPRRRGCRGLMLTERRAPPADPGGRESLARGPSSGSPSLGSATSRGRSAIAPAGRLLGPRERDPEGQASLYEMPDDLLTGNLVVVLGAEGGACARSTLEVDRTTW